MAKDSDSSPAAAATASATSANYGFSPRIYPRPAYPSFVEQLMSTGKDIVYQGGIVGTIITIFLYPYYLKLLPIVERLLGSYYSEAAAFACILTMVHITVYVTINGMFGIFDTYGFFQEYKLMRRPYMIPKSSLIIRTLLEAAFGQLIFGPIALFYLYPGIKKFGLLALDAPLPSAFDISTTYMFAHLFNGFGFYWAHRVFHSKLLYSTFHKQHHEYTGAIGICAEYANPVEQILANMLPSIGGVIFFGCHHPLCVFVWLALRLQQTYEAHSGYCFAGTLLDKVGLAHATDAAHHDYHHSVNRGNFGTIWMDWIFGTQDGYCADGGQDGYIAKKKSSTK